MKKTLVSESPFVFQIDMGSGQKVGKPVWQDHAWPNAVETMFQRFGRPESYPTLLEVVRMLPEDSSRYHWCSWINVLMPPAGW